MSDTDTLRAALNTIDTQGYFLSVLIRAVDAALTPAAPPGDPHTIETQATAYQTAADQSKSALADMLKVKTSQLPQSWRGQAAENATQALQAVHDWVAADQKALSTGDQTLSEWADHLRTAQQRDTQGHNQLSTLRPLLQQLWLDELVSPRVTKADALLLSRLRDAAASACHDRLSAHELAESAAATANKTLNEYATFAVDDVPVLLAPGTNALTAVTLAYEVEGAPPEVIAGMRRAAQQLLALSPTDRAMFEKLTAKASSPLEAAYLWRALGAGYTVKQVQAFDSVIHGQSDQWLIQHLDPVITNPNQTPGVANQWQASTWKALNPLGEVGTSDLTQGSEGDCVAASTVMARLSADPVLMLAVTTGQGPMARMIAPVDPALMRAGTTGQGSMAQMVGPVTRPGNDSTSATTARLQTLYNNYYSVGQLADGDSTINASNGIGPTGQRVLDNNLLQPMTGDTYQQQSLTTRRPGPPPPPGWRRSPRSRRQSTRGSPSRWMWRIPMARLPTRWSSSVSPATSSRFITRGA
jgi:uncharacterized protein YukE